MNHYRPAEIINKEGERTGLFHYVRRVGNIATPVGYCAKKCPGHSTPEKAALHYKDFLLDQTNYTGEADPSEGCAICSRWAKNVATTLHGYQYILCDQHHNEVGMSQALGDLRDILIKE